MGGGGGSPTFDVTTTDFGASNPIFVPEVAWTDGTPPTGVTSEFNTENTKLTMTTTAKTPAGDYTFKVVSAKAAPDTNKFESAEATLTVGKLTATIEWVEPFSFAYTGEVQAPTATVSNALVDDDVTIKVTGGQADVSDKLTATANALDGAAKDNYELPTEGLTQEFAITIIACGKTAPAPDATLAVKADTSITLTAVTVEGEAVEYTQNTTGGAPAEDATWQENVEFTSLTANTEYTFFARVKATTNHEAGPASAGTKIKTLKTAYDGTEASAPSDTPTAKTDASITLAAVIVPEGGTFQYAKSTTSTAPTADAAWQDVLEFINLAPNTPYFFFARVKESDDHAAGGVSAGTSITTEKSDCDITADSPSKTPISMTATSIKLADVIVADETVEYLMNTTGDAPAKEDSWQISTEFRELTADTKYYFFARVRENETHKAGSASNCTEIKTDLSDAQKVEAAEKVVADALKVFTATNATNADAIIAEAKTALTGANVRGVTLSWDAPGAFSITEATEEEDGKVTGTIKLICNTSSDTVSFNVTIPKLASDPKAKIATVKEAIEAVLNSYTASNATTAAEIMAIADAANTNSGITGVSVAWKDPSDFNRTPATSAAGSIKGTMVLSINGTTTKGEVNVNLTIAPITADKTILTTALANANNAKVGITTSNESASSVTSGTKFVSDAEMKALTDTIASAQIVASTANATTAEVAKAVTDLNTAVAKFKKDIKTGTYTPSSGDGGSFTGGGSTTTPPTVVPPTTTQPNPPTTVETEVPATVDQNGNANVNVSDKTIQDAIDKAVTEGKKNGTSDNGISVVINVTTGGKDANTVTVALPKTVQEKVIAGKIMNTVVVVDSPDIAINMNLATITEINKQARTDVQLSATRIDNTKLTGEAKTAIEGRPTFDLKATYANGSKAVNNFGSGSVIVEIPYTLQKGETAGGIYAAYVDENGKVNFIANSSYDAKNKTLRFVTNHFSVYGVGYKESTDFTDVASHWAKTDIEFVINRGLMSGTSESTFSPKSAMTRGMLVTALGKLAGVDVSSYKTSSFTDVKADSYYMGYIEWANKNGIVNGISKDKFAPNQAITREQMAVIIENYAKATGYILPNVYLAKTFADDHKIGVKEKDSVTKIQMAGIIKGNGNNVLNPKGKATKAATSAILHRYIERVIGMMPQKTK